MNSTDQAQRNVHGFEHIEGGRNFNQTLKDDDRGDDQQAADGGLGKDNGTDLPRADLFQYAQQHRHQQQRPMQGQRQQGRHLDEEEHDDGQDRPGARKEIAHRGMDAVARAGMLPADSIAAEIPEGHAQAGHDMQDGERQAGRG